GDSDQGLAVEGFLADVLDELHENRVAVPDQVGGADVGTELPAKREDAASGFGARHLLQGGDNLVPVRGAPGAHVHQRSRQSPAILLLVLVRQLRRRGLLISGGLDGRPAAAGGREAQDLVLGQEDRLGGGIARDQPEHEAEQKQEGPHGSLSTKSQPERRLSSAGYPNISRTYWNRFSLWTIEASTHYHSPMSFAPGGCSAGHASAIAPEPGIG